MKHLNPVLTVILLTAIGVGLAAATRDSAHTDAVEVWNKSGIKAPEVWNKSGIKAPELFQGRECREVVTAQRALLAAQERQIDALVIALDDCRSTTVDLPVDPPARPPVDDDPPVRPPAGDDPPVRPPVDDDPPVRPPVDDDPPTLAQCDDIRDAVVRELVRDVNGYWRVTGQGREPWDEWQVGMSHYGPGPWEGDWLVNFSGDPGFPAGDHPTYFLSVGAYRSGGVVHGTGGRTIEHFIVAPNARQPGVIFRVKMDQGVVVNPHQDQYGLMKWGYRTYDGDETAWLYGYFDGVGTINGKSAAQEHPLYASPSGNFEIGWCLMENWGGQLQIASRVWDQNPHNAAWTDGEWIRIHDVCLHENGRNLVRASFPLTIAFNRQTDASDVDDDGNRLPHRANVLIERVHFRSTEFGDDTYHNGNPLKAKGGILIRGSDSDPNEWTFAAVAVTDSGFALKDSDRAIMDYRNIEALRIARLDFRSVTGNRRVDLHTIGRLEWDGDTNMTGVTVRYCWRPSMSSDHDWNTVADGGETFVLVDGVRE